MRRRAFMTQLAGAAATWPIMASAQQPTMPVIGYLSASPVNASSLAAFHKGLGETGYIEGQNVAVEIRSANGYFDRLPALAADLVSRRVAVIFALTGDASPLAAKAATSTIPIVFVFGGDPVRYGLVASFNRPGGNATGAVVLSTSTLVVKRLELVREVMPNATSISLLVNPSSPAAESYIAVAQATAREQRWRLHVLRVSTEGDLESAFAAHRSAGAAALVVTSSSYFSPLRDRLSALAVDHAVPVIYDRPDFVVDGGLMSYGASQYGLVREAAIYAGRILKGEKPGDLPVIQPTRVELVINLRAAKALGIVIPESLLARADELFE